MTPREKLIETVVKPIAEKHDADVKLVMGKCKDETVVRARDEAICAVYEIKGRLNETGRFFGYDHSYASIAMGRHHNRNGVDSQYRALFLRNKRYKPKKRPTIDESAVDPILAKHGLTRASFQNVKSRPAGADVEARFSAIHEVWRDVAYQNAALTKRLIGCSESMVKRALERRRGGA